MKLLLRALMLNIMALSSLQVFAIANPLPEGSYQESCTNCVYDQETRTLKCRCKNRRGEYQETERSGCSKYENINGQLQCEYGRESQDLY